MRPCLFVNLFALTLLLVDFYSHSFFSLNVINRMSFSIRMKISYPRVYKIHMHTLLFETELDFMCLPRALHCTLQSNVYVRYIFRLQLCQWLNKCFVVFKSCRFRWSMVEESNFLGVSFENDGTPLQSIN